jgi:hypothetical protein
MAAPVDDAVRRLKDQGLASTSLNVPVLLPAPFPIVAKTTSYTVLPSDKCGTLFTNRGASGAVTFTLPAVAAVLAGTWYYFCGLVAQDLIVAPPVADTLITFNELDADSIAASTAGGEIGALVKVISDGTSWIAFGEVVGVTYTVAD